MPPPYGVPPGRVCSDPAPSRRPARAGARRPGRDAALPDLLAGLTCLFFASRRLVQRSASDRQGGRSSRPVGFDIECSNAAQPSSWPFSVVSNEPMLTGGQRSLSCDPPRSKQLVRLASCTGTIWRARRRVGRLKSSPLAAHSSFGPDSFGLAFAPSTLAARGPATKTGLPLHGASSMSFSWASPLSSSRCASAASAMGIRR
jgi:hypothetical protein